MRTLTVTCGPYAAPSATNIRTASSISGAGNVTLNGSLVSSGTATLDQPRRVLFTSAGNDSGITFTVTGTDWNNSPVSETLTGANATTAYTVYDYKTVTSIVSSGASAGNVSIGTNGVASSRPIFLDNYANGDVYIQTNTGGVTGPSYTLQYSNDNPNNAQYGIGTTTYTTMSWISSALSGFAPATTAVSGTQSGAPTCMRLLLSNAGSSTTAYVIATFNQSGMVAY